MIVKVRTWPVRGAPNARPPTPGVKKACAGNLLFQRAPTFPDAAHSTQELCSVPSFSSLLRCARDCGIDKTAFLLLGSAETTTQFGLLTFWLAIELLDSEGSVSCTEFYLQDNNTHVHRTDNLELNFGQH